MVDHYPTPPSLTDIPNRPAPSLLLAGVGLFGLLAVLYGVYCIPNFGSPLVGVSVGDVDQWEYMGYYVAKNLTFTPLPALNWVGNQTFYPYGTNHVFQGWAFEQNFAYALCYRLAGAWGPWLKVYYVLSLFLCAAGSFLLLQFDYGVRRAFVVGILVTFFNFYALNKFPGHYAYAVIHWTVMSILTDFMLTRRIVTGQPVSLRFLGLKLLLLTLCLGQDVGYIVGYALSSLTLTGVFVVGWLGGQFYRNRPTVEQYFVQTLAAWRRQWATQRTSLLLLTVLATGFGLLYVPLLASMFTQANSFQFANRFAGGQGWVHPVRALFPYLDLPGINALTNPFAAYLTDTPEGDGAGSPGWFLVLLGGIGFLKTPPRLRWAFVPLLVFGILYALDHPIRMPLVQIFPWCRFYRMPARVTLIYPVLLAIFTLHWQPRMPKLAWLALLLVGAAELITVLNYRHNLPVHHFPASFKPYMNRVKQQPGEAVLDWPFCLVGGNGIGLRAGLCPIYDHTSTLYALQRFHGKKTVGQYFGRLHDSQLQPFVQAGWPALLDHPDIKNSLSATTLTTELTADQWQFFEQFYVYNDFAGINLYIDLLPPASVASFYQHLGRPVAQTEIAGAGRVVFIPKPPRWRKLVNRQLGLSIHAPCGCTTPPTL